MWHLVISNNSNKSLNYFELKIGQLTNYNNIVIKICYINITILIHYWYLYDIKNQEAIFKIYPETIGS